MTIIQLASIRFRTWCTIVIGILSPTIGWCFPEMIRHGYVNCTSCHVSPTGGGVLTQYGRELSRETLSTWGTQSLTESAFAYGLVKPPEWLDVMGFYRSVYAYQKTPNIEQGLFIFMQNDIELSAKVKDWYFVGAIGYQNQPNDITLLQHLISRRHYVNFRPTSELSFRTGRFYSSYGINTADHVIPIKRDLGWDERQETYNFEAAWIGEAWNLYLTANFGRPDQPTLQAKTGLIANASVALGDTYKVGLSYLQGTGQTPNRHLGGIWGILGFTPRFFLLTEWDIQQQPLRTGASDLQWGFINYQRLDYELIQGLHIYLTQDFSELNLNNPLTLKNSFGLGLQFFPRPHFELNLSWQKLRSLSIANSYNDFAWLMFQFYL